MSESEDIEQRINQLLYKHLIQDLTDEETLELESYCRKDASLIQVIQRLDNKELIEKYLQYREEARTDRRLPVVMARIRGSHAPVWPMKRKIFWIPVAAAAILLIYVGTPILISYIHPAKEVKTALTLNNKTQQSNQVKYDTLETQGGEQRSITLSDSTRVWLNSRSSLRYPADFKGGSRSVELIGEAYFEVRSNKDDPFFVRIIKKDKSLDIRVLGTSFDVTAYKDEPDIRTTLLKGKVQVPVAHGYETLTDNQQLILRDDGTWERLNKDLPKAVIGWKQGQFICHNDSLPRILRQIARQYNKVLTIDMTSQTRIYSFSLPYDIPLSDMLSILSDSNKNFHYNIDDKVIHISD